MELIVSNDTLMKKLGLGLLVALKRAKLKSILIFLAGDLGAGKTTLVQGFIESAGVKDPIASPTYTLVESYETGIFNIHHFDLYRLDAPSELELIGIRDYFLDEAFCLIEWAERGEGVLPLPDLTLSITIKEEDKRTVAIEAVSARGKHVLQQLEKAPFG